MGGKLNMKEGVFPQMKECAAAIFRHVTSKLNPMNISYCFELFGVDFMVDESGKVYLIEINTSPALFRKGKHLKVSTVQCLGRIMTSLPPVNSGFQHTCSSSRVGHAASDD